jgi:hypothetical protein
MERHAAVSILYDTLDALVAVKIDLRSHDGRRAALMGDNGGRIGSEVDYAITNIRAAIASLEEHITRTGGEPGADGEPSQDPVPSRAS